MPDLLDLAGPTGLPDFMQLANGSQPTMMPNAPSPAAGAMYGADMGRHDQMIQQAAALAQMSARMKQQQAEEMASAGPGRMAEIGLKSAQAQDALADPNSVALPRAKRGAEMAVEKAKQGQAEMAGISDWLNAYDSAKTTSQKASIQQLMVDNGVTIKGKSIGGLKPQEFDDLMTTMRGAQTNDEKMAIQKMIWGEGGTKERIGAAANMTKEKIADMASQWHLKVAAIAKQMNTTPDKVIGSLMMQVDAASKGEGPPLNPVQQQLYMEYHNLKAYGVDVRAAAIPPRASMDAGGNPQLAPPNVAPLPKPGFIDPEVASPGAAPKAATLDVVLPDAAMKALKTANGQSVQFSNGQVWKLVNGKAVRVK